MAQLLVITGALLFCIFTAAIAELRTAERTLRNVNVDLEQQVQARTAKLTATNEQLLDSEERLRVATDAAEMYAWEVDVNTRIIKYADNHARVLGFALPADFAAMQEIIHPDDRGDH